MSKYEQSSSDPLPFIQVDRSSKPKAAMLADVLGVTRQHAMGSLVDWWDLCGEPRELERIVEATPPNEEPEVILTPGDAALRFRLASTKDVEPVVLARIGLLEERPDGNFRVRGMSRYFDAIKGRLQSRKAAAAGGKASAETRRKRYGSAQPTSDGRSEPASEVASSALRTAPEATPKRPRSDSRSDAEADTEAASKRNRTLEVRGHRSDSKSIAPAPQSPRETDLLCADFREVIGSPYRWEGAKDGKAFAELRKLASLEEIRARWRRGLQLPVEQYVSCRSVAELAQKWNRLADAKPAQRVSIEHQPSRIL